LTGSKLAPAVDEHPGAASGPVGDAGDHAGAESAPAGSVALGSLEVALINNMPDGAFVEAEHQFVRLLSAAAGPAPLRVGRYVFASVDRPPLLRDRIRAEYLPVAALAERAPLAVVVTGSEPRRAALAEEDYWPELTGLLDWACAGATSLVLSCLAAHAALAHLDGLARTPLPKKCSGVWEHEVVDAGPLGSGLPATVALPHSRHNGVETARLLDAGYQVVLDSAVGWGVASGEHGRCRLLLLQGHPEYATDTLLREYRRDLGRALAGTAAYPELPTGYLDGAGEAVAAEFRAGVDTGRFRSAAELPFDALAGHVRSSWQVPAGRLVSNWFATLPAPAGHHPLATAEAVDTPASLAEPLGPPRQH